jgi:transposase
MKQEAYIPLAEPQISLSMREYQRLQDDIHKLEEVQKAVIELGKENATLRWELDWLKRHFWGRSSEKNRLPQDPSQLEICFDSPQGVEPEKEIEKAKEEADNTTKEYNRFRKTFKKKPTPHSRQPIPEHIPRLTTTLEPDVNLSDAVRIGEEVTERLAIKSVEVYVEQTVRPKYKMEDGRICIAPLPLAAHPGSNASESVLAHIAVAKYADHLPLNRQIEIFERSNIHLAASTVSNWMIAAAERIEPIYNELRKLVQNSRYVMADETTYKVLETDKPGSLHQGYMWNFYLPSHKTPFFEYHKGRGSTGVGTLLDCKVRVVQSDGYGVYDVFNKLPGYLHLCCWAHVRREFFDAQNYDPPRAKHVLKEIGKLYAVERQILEEGLKGEDIVKLRQKEAYPVICSMEEWAMENLPKTHKGSPIDKAIMYMLNRIEQLSFYVNDAEFSIDNNPVERSIRPLTLNRKNTLFAGSHYAAHAAAIFFTLLGACRENKVNPYEWLKDALIKVQLCQPTDYSSLLPWNWNSSDK